ncbi:chemotaxis protein CheW [Leptospira kanakyensis]|uniref:chemotaxis protein CheW n=1 Tax=Leptospira kanakyensis TaxID=2484968 RepID=UPI00223CDD37|nr:chemotaxis protein CheW [Leptospira kanakyensis]MCW7469605.1 chemotaxis protein CheW [Leptospira kanakyensis]
MDRKELSTGSIQEGLQNNEDCKNTILSVEDIKNPDLTVAQLLEEKKVVSEKLSTLLELVGELVIAESNITQHPTIKSIKNESLNSTLSRFHKILIDLQDVAFSTRMIPISGVFKKISRIVHELQNQSDIKVLLHTSGEDTEIDKSRVDLIFEPIVYILKNSIEYEFESSDKRLSNGKSEIKNIYLSARQSINEVLVTVRDDGHGLDRRKILEKAKQNGIIIDDSIRLTNQGTTFVLRIPISLGTMKGTVVRIGIKYFTIQTVELREFVSLRDKKEIELDKDQNVLDIRGTFVPIFNINQILNHKESIEYDNKDPLIIVLEYEKKLLGIRVDEIIGSQNVVIKPLVGIMEQAQGVNGFTILGNGNVSLILDAKSIFSKQEISGVK